MKLNACIFDLDGVIVDTAKYHYLAWKRLANELGFDFTIEQNERLKGVSRMRSLGILLEIGKYKMTDADKLSAAEKKNNWYVEYIAKLTPDEILPGAYEFLIELKTFKIKIGLGSASKNAPMILQRLELTRFFDVIVDGSRVTSAKPDPEVFLKAAAELAIPNHECVVFEDAQAGVEAALNAGMLCVGVGDENTLSAANIVISGFEGLDWQSIKNQLKVF